MALLPDGRAIVAGGQDADLDIVASAEVFDPVSNTFSPLEGISGEMTTTRYGAQGASLPDGRVLITGGFEFNDTTTSAEVFERGPEPVLTGDGGFGAQVVGSTSAPRTFTVANAGVSRLEVADVRISGDARDDFAVDDGCDGAQLAPGQSCSVTATFSPTDLGARAANLAVIDNAPSHVQRIALSGSGVPFSAPAPAAPVPTPTPAAPAKPKTLTLSCALKKKSARRALACTATPPVKGQKVSSLTLRLTRAGRTLARGSAFGPKLTLRARRALKPGRYTLRAIVTIGSQATTLTKALVLR